MFDDSQMHSGFNMGKRDRCVLIVDLMRKPGMVKGRATGEMTDKLEQYIEFFKNSIGGTTNDKSSLIFR